MKPLIIANWKMNLTLDEADSLAKSLSESIFSKQLIIAPPAPYIAYLAKKYHQLSFCAQDVSVKNKFGAYTGENSAKFFQSCGVNYALIGHSERRSLFAETNEIIACKAQNCLDNGIIPIICIGESLEVRQNGSYKEFLLHQLDESAPETDKPFIIAYEPVWSIGTKITPTIDEINEIAQLIKTRLLLKLATEEEFAGDTERKYRAYLRVREDSELLASTHKLPSKHEFQKKSTTANRSLAKNIRLVYGGSVNSENSKDISNIKDVSGVLIGGASLNKDELFKILNS